MRVLTEKTFYSYFLFWLERLQVFMIARSFARCSQIKTSTCQEYQTYCYMLPGNYNNSFLGHLCGIVFHLLINLKKKTKSLALKTIAAQCYAVTF